MYGTVRWRRHYHPHCTLHLPCNLPSPCSLLILLNNILPPPFILPVIVLLPALCPYHTRHVIPVHTPTFTHLYLPYPVPDLVALYRTLLYILLLVYSPLRLSYIVVPIRACTLHDCSFYAARCHHTFTFPLVMACGRLGSFPFRYRGATRLFADFAHARWFGSFRFAVPHAYALFLRCTCATTTHTFYLEHLYATRLRLFYHHPFYLPAGPTFTILLPAMRTYAIAPIHARGDTLLFRFVTLPVLRFLPLLRTRSCEVYYCTCLPLPFTTHVALRFWLFRLNLFPIAPSCPSPPDDWWTDDTFAFTWPWPVCWLLCVYPSPFIERCCRVAMPRVTLLFYGCLRCWFFTARGAPRRAHRIVPRGGVAFTHTHRLRLVAAPVCSRNIPHTALPRITYHRDSANSYLCPYATFPIAYGMPAPTTTTVGGDIYSLLLPHTFCQHCYYLYWWMVILLVVDCCCHLPAGSPFTDVLAT